MVNLTRAHSTDSPDPEDSGQSSGEWGDRRTLIWCNCMVFNFLCCFLWRVSNKRAAKKSGLRKEQKALILTQEH